MRNKTKITIAIITSTVVVIIAVACYFHHKIAEEERINYYYNIEEVNDYFLISVSEPQKSLFGRISPPNVEIKQQKNWGNDSIEVAKITSEVKGKYNFAVEELMKLGNPPKAKDGVELLEYYAKKEVLIDIISARHCLIRFRHVRSYDAKELLEILKKCNGDIVKIEDYVQDKKISVQFYTIYSH